MGHICIDRRILEWEWYKKSNTKCLFLHCLLKANWKDGKFENHIIPRGSFVSSVPNLSAETGLTVSRVRTALNHLKATGELTVTRYPKYSVITVNNYYKYQMGNTQNSEQVIIPEGAKKGYEEIRDNFLCADSLDYAAIIDYLNLKAGTEYRSTSKYIRKYIDARFAEGYTIDDFKRVIDIKCAEWSREPYPGEKDMRPFLRPSTLFGTKFESYLNQKGAIYNNLAERKNSFNNFPQRDYDFEQLEKHLLDC